MIHANYNIGVLLYVTVSTLTNHSPHFLKLLFLYHPLTQFMLIVMVFLK